MDDNANKTNDSSAIMVVEDDLICLRLLTRTLSGNGYEVIPAANAEVALKQVQIKLPLLIILDIIMPGMNGYDLCKMLKTDKNTAAIPVIFCSGLTGEDDKKKGVEAGGIDYITKPYDFKHMLERVDIHFKTRRAQIDLKTPDSEL